MRVPDTLTSNYEALADTVNLGDADAYVHVNEGTDDLLRYLTRVDGEDKYYGFLQTADDTVLAVTARYLQEANEKFPGDRIVGIEPDESVVERVMAELGDFPSILVPDTTPIGLVEDLSDEATVTVVEEPDDVLCEKTSEEQTVLAHMAEGVQYGIARAESVLAQSQREGEDLIWNGEPLTTDRLRIEIKKALAECGLSDAENVIIGAGESCSDLHFTGNDRIAPDETVLIDLGPRGPFGYYGDISRTFVPGEPSKWAEETYDIVEEALEAAFDVLSNGAGLTTGELYRSMADIIESYGYGTGISETTDEVGLTHGTGHGIGVRIHEKPFQTSDGQRELAAGNVITVEPGIYDPTRGGVRLEDMVIVGENGFENLMDYPKQIRPAIRQWELP